MDVLPFQRPSSPGSQSLFSQFTTLDDDLILLSSLDTELNLLNICFDPFFEFVDPGPWDGASIFGQPNTIAGADTIALEPLHYDVSESHREFQTAETAVQPNSSRKRKRRESLSEGTPQYRQIVFSVDGKPVKSRRRSNFSEERKRQVNEIRKRGACLRCRLIRRSCSGDDPCERCIFDAQAKAGSRVLMWMECIRPSLEGSSVFEKVNLNGTHTHVEDIADSLLETETWSKGLPFQLDCQSASTYFASWIANGTNHSNFYIPRFLRSEQFRELVSHELGPKLSRKLQLLLYLTKKLHNWDPHETHRGYHTKQLVEIRHHLGTIMLRELEKRLRPSALQHRSLLELQILFLVIFGMSWATRYTAIDMILNGKEMTNDLIWKSEAFARLLVHYLVYIGSTTSIIDPTSIDTILLKNDFRLDKPGTRIRCLSSNSAPCDSGSEIQCYGTSSPTGFHCALRGASSGPFDPNGNCRRCSPWHYHRLELSDGNVPEHEAAMDEALAKDEMRPLSHWTLYFTHEESFEIYNIRTLRAFAYKPVTAHAQPASHFQLPSYSSPNEQYCTACEDPMPRGED